MAAIIAPCIDANIKPDTIYQNKIDTLISTANTIIERINDTVYVTKTLAGKTIIKTNTQTVTKTVTDIRMLDACAIKSRTIEEMLIVEQTNLKASQKDSRNKTWWIVGLSALLVASHFLRSYFGRLFSLAKGLFK